MSVRVDIFQGPLQNSAVQAPDKGAVGAWVVFEGIVRENEGDASIRGLEYEVYEPMASRMLEQMARDLTQRHRLQTLLVDHSRGFVGVGERSFRLSIGAAHRAEALNAMEEFIAWMKRDVPIWKSAVAS